MRYVLFLVGAVVIGVVIFFATSIMAATSLITTVIFSVLIGATAGMGIAIWSVTQRKQTESERPNDTQLRSNPGFKYNPDTLSKELVDFTLKMKLARLPEQVMQYVFAVVEDILNQLPSAEAGDRAYQYVDMVNNRLIRNLTAYGQLDAEGKRNMADSKVKDLQTLRGELRECVSFSLVGAPEYRQNEDILDYFWAINRLPDNLCQLRFAQPDILTPGCYAVLGNELFRVAETNVVTQKEDGETWTWYDSRLESVTTPDHTFWISAEDDGGLKVTQQLGDEVALPVLGITQQQVETLYEREDDYPPITVRGKKYTWDDGGKATITPRGDTRGEKVVFVELLNSDNIRLYIEWGKETPTRAYFSKPISPSAITVLKPEA